MHRSRVWLLCLGLYIGLPALPAWADATSSPPAGITRTGVLQEAPWRIDMPPVWNGELVILAHGFEPVGATREDVWPAAGGTAELLAAGYAVAQSGYATQGWAVADAIADTERLRAQFLTAHPETTHSWIIGFSMGGAVAIGTLERLPAQYSGGVAFCGANLPGQVLAGELLTSLLGFDALFAGEAELPPGGLAGAAAGARPQDTLYEAIAAAIAARPDAAAVLARRLQVTPEQLPGTLSLHALVWHDLVRRMGGVPVGNRVTRYAGFGDDAAFNQRVRRLDPDPSAARALRSLALTGALSRPLVIQYNRDDPTIPPRFEGVYPALAARSAKVPPHVLPPTGEGHCGFKGADVVRALQAIPR